MYWIKAEELNRLRLGCERYETVKKLNSQQWQEMWRLKYVMLTPFDEIIDELKPFMEKEGKSWN